MTYRNLILAGLLMMLIPLQYLYAENSVKSPVPQLLTRQVQWRPVRGASGYILEVQEQDKSTPLQSFEVKNPFSEVHLLPGSYKIRVAGLNKFGQPGAYSRWYDLKLDAALLPDNESRLQWDSRALLPGYRQIQSDSAWRGYAYIGGLTALAISGWNQKLAGDTVARSAENRMLFFGAAALAGNPILANVLYFERLNLRSKYDRHQQNQRTAGWLFLGMYLWQVFDALWLTDPISSSQEIIKLDQAHPETFWDLYSYQTPAGEERTEIGWRHQF